MFEVVSAQDRTEQRPNQLIEFSRSLIAGFFGAKDSNAGLWSLGILLALAEIVLLSMWIVHPGRSSLGSTAWRMMCLALPYAVGLGLLGNVSLMLSEQQVTAEAYIRVRNWICWLLFASYLFLPFVMDK